MRHLAVPVLGLLSVLLSSCAIPQSAGRRASLVGLGAAAGGVAAKELSNGDSGAIAGGAAGGAALVNLALRDDETVRQAGYDEGYIQGQSDSIKRHYFLRHEQEKRPLAPENKEGQVVHYRIPVQDETETEKGKKPKTVTVRVVE